MVLWGCKIEKSAQLTHKLTVWHPLAAEQTLRLGSCKKLKFFIATKYVLVWYEILTNNANIFLILNEMKI